jgi:hypothetical protein
MCFLKLEPLTSEQTGVAVVRYGDFRGPYFIAITPSFRDLRDFQKNERQQNHSIFIAITSNSLDIVFFGLMLFFVCLLKHWFCLLFVVGV